MDDMSEIQESQPAKPRAQPTPGTTSPAPVSPSAPAAAESSFGTPAPDLRESVVQVLQSCYDPEIPVNIYDMGLIYGIDVSPAGDVGIKMTLTSPACPVAETLPPDVQRKVSEIPGVKSAKVDVVWEPTWGKHLLSEAARLQLGLDGY